ncbi:type II toxin-antitoxin system VapC family toxin [Methanobrevibacter filiformis]|uniref:tRNA(FMet)-specific endonuclease VapC n=1 Tax=Methanobrevibacter filiformis TaxID=55758 RepID=A0A166AB03_9EURY|nr:type II toxin-antitoxin system VapC family toxin [Methanobrevibacter filiformis]KZX11803.1 tRNA(fMet)-specific endonuclease VapC [Methanobrevibacter filiformis]
MIFLDANFIIDLFVDTEDNHEKAVKIYKQIKDKQLIISNSVILEVMTVLNIKLKVSKEILERSYSRLNGGKFKIVEDVSIYDETIERMVSYFPQRLPFWDCLYIELMEHLGIEKIATFDKHFRNKGIEVIGK